MTTGPMRIEDGEVDLNDVYRSMNDGQFRGVTRPHSFVSSFMPTMVARRLSASLAFFSLMVV